MLPHAHVSNAVLELVKRKFQEVIALMSKLLPPYEASVHICSYLNNQTHQMSDLQAILALIGVSEANSKLQNEKIPLKVKNVFISSTVFFFNQHALFAIGSMHTTAKKQWCVETNHLVSNDQRLISYFNYLPL